MTEHETASKMMAALKAAQSEPAPVALTRLNDLIELTKTGGAASLEIEELRSSAFMAICELGKALHRGQSTDGLWERAIDVTERWKALAR